MVGMLTAAVISRASSGSTSSSTMAKAPAFSTASASASRRSFSDVGPALDLVAALFLHRLRQHADVAHDGDAGPAQRDDFRHDRDAALELHRLRAGLDEHARVGHRGLGRLVGVIGKIGDDERPGLRARDGGDMMADLLERHLGRVRITEHDHADRIADEDQRHARLVEQPRGGVIVARSARELSRRAPWPGRIHSGRDFLRRFHAR